jgi:hypothetical protein
MGCRAWSRRDVLMVERGLGRREGRTLVCGCCSLLLQELAPPHHPNSPLAAVRSPPIRGTRT